jgi:mannose-6-phosphate isomerase-like protein (cupin superfamily)
MSPATTALQPFAVPAHEGEAYWWFGQLGEIKATAEQTGGAYTLVEITVGPGYATPLHVHHGEDEAFLMIEGEATFEVGDQVVPAGPGAFLFGPRDIPHRWSTATGARLFYLLSPGGFEALIRDVGVPAGERTVPPADLAPPPDAAEIVARHGNAIVA